MTARASQCGGVVLAQNDGRGAEHELGVLDMGEIAHVALMAPGGGGGQGAVRCAARYNGADEHDGLVIVVELWWADGLT